ncbi:7029_t:CDS:2, partial [Acaulospora morrowiae]
MATPQEKTFILLPPAPVDIGKAHCRVSKIILEKRNIVEGQWVRLDSGEASAIDVNLIIRFKYVDEENVEERQFLDFGFVWNNGSEIVRRQTMRSMLKGMPVCKGFVISDQRSCLEIEILDVSPSDTLSFFTKDTNINLFDKENVNANLSNMDDLDSITSSLEAMKLNENSSNEAIPGLEQAYKALYEVVSYPLLYPDLIQQLNIECPK